MTYLHPTYTAASVAAQTRLASLNTDRLAFAGAYHGLGLPRGRLPLRRRRRRGARGDVVSAAAAGRARPACAAHGAATAGPVRSPTSSTHRTTMWLVDVADTDAAFPRWLRPLASIRAADHFARRRRRAAGRQGPRLPRRAATCPGRAHRVLMLANARSLGYVFDPLTTYFCFDARRHASRACSPRCTTPTASGTATRSTVAAQSAATGRQGVLRLAVLRRRGPLRHPHPAHRRRSVAVAHLADPGRARPSSPPRCTATSSPPPAGRVLRAVARDPLPSQRVSALIRWHGVRLWLRRLPVVPRRPHQAPKGMHAMTHHHRPRAVAACLAPLLPRRPGVRRPRRGRAPGRRSGSCATCPSPPGSRPASVYGAPLAERRPLLEVDQPRGVLRPARRTAR